MAKLAALGMAVALFIGAVGCSTPPSVPTPVPATPAPSTPAPSAATPPPRSSATVVRVVDGDTVDVSLDGRQERIRLIGMDTPETVDPR